MGMPEIKVPQTNFLQMALTANQIKSNKANQNYLQKKQGWEEDDRKDDKEMRKYRIESQAISTALKAGNQDQVNQIYKSLGGMSESGITISGKDVSIDYGDSTFKGPSSVVSELVTNIGKNPEYIKNPQTWAWFAGQGGSIDQHEVKDTRTPEQKNYLFAKKNEGYRGSFVEWTDRKGKAANTKYGWVNQEDGSKVWSELKPGVKSAKALGKEDDPEKKKAAAQKEYIRIMGLIDKAKNSGGLDQAMLATMPDEVKNVLLGADRSEYVTVLESYAEGLRTDYGLKFKGNKPAAGGGATHVFVPGKGLVPVEEVE